MTLVMAQFTDQAIYVNPMENVHWEVFNLILVVPSPLKVLSAAAARNTVEAAACAPAMTIAGRRNIANKVPARHTEAAPQTSTASTRRTYIRLSLVWDTCLAETVLVENRVEQLIALTMPYHSIVRFPHASSLMPIANPNSPFHV